MGLDTYLKLFFVILVLVTFGFIIKFVVGVFYTLPASTEANAISPGDFGNTIYTTSYALVDDSLLVVLVFAIFLGILQASLFPRKIMAVVNIISILALAVVVLTLNTGLLTLDNALSVNTILPFSTGLYTGGYAGYMVFFGLIVSAILNLREEDE